MAKGNNGSAARRRTTKKLLLAAGCSLVLVSVIVCFGGGGASSVNVGSRTTAMHSHSAGNGHGHGGDDDDGRYTNANPNRQRRQIQQQQQQHQGEEYRHRQQQQQQRQQRHNHQKQRNPNNPIYHEGEGDDQESHRDVHRFARNNHGGRGNRRHPRGYGGYDNGDGDDETSGSRSGDEAQAPGAYGRAVGGGFAKRRAGNGFGNGPRMNKRIDWQRQDADDERDAMRRKTFGRDDTESEGEGEDEDENPSASARDPHRIQMHGNNNHGGRNKKEDDVAVAYRKELLESWGSGRSNQKRAELALEGILNGSTNLVSISHSYSLKPTSDGSYRGVTGKFCKLDFALHKNDPSKYPMFRFLLQASPDCDSPVSFDLQKITYLARQRDQQVEQGIIHTNNNNGAAVSKVLNVTAVAFHESRCGSTLVANSMIAMDPRKHRAYSESSPPVNALHICGDYFDKCSREQAAAILKDTIHMMSRTDDHREERVFFKFQSITSKAIPTFQMAFPDVPWMYVYRDPVQVMMSHIKDDPTLKRAICTKTRRFPPKEIKAIAKRHGRSSPEDLDPSEYCAAHLAQLTEAAVASLNDKAIPVAYDRLPGMMWETIMPKILGRSLEPFEVRNLETVSKSYSKQGKNNNKQGEFTGDSEQKDKKASDAVRKAAREFLKESFDQLTAFESKVLR